MRQEYNEKVFPVHTPSILHGALVGAGSLYLEVGTLRNHRFNGNFVINSLFMTWYSVRAVTFSTRMYQVLEYLHVS
jgi:hypothetical protein